MLPALSGRLNLNGFGLAAIPRVDAELFEFLGDGLTMDQGARFAPTVHPKDLGTDNRADTAARA